MLDLLEKHRSVQERHRALLALGKDAVGIPYENMISTTRAYIAGKPTLLAGTNNYLGLTFDQDCIKAGQEALSRWGTGTTGSRVANGSYEEHFSLEQELAAFLGRKHCLIFTTGYQANVGIISGLCGRDDTLFIDADSHASIYDGCMLAGAQVIRFRHNDAKDLRKRLERRRREGQNEKGGSLVVLEGLYSMLGDRAPLSDFIALKKEFGFQLLVDEAHSFGVLGKKGRGLAEEANVEAACDFIVGTFSKSLGSVGGFAASDHPLFETLRYVMHPYMFTASSCPAVVATTRKALEKIAHKPALKDQLRQNSERLFSEIKALGFKTGCEVASPVISVFCESQTQAIENWNKLLEIGVYVNIALPPGTPGGVSLLRCSVSAAHTPQDISEIVQAFSRLR